MIFTFFFEISLGSVLWLYLAEISTEKGMSLALFMNWVVVIAVSFATAPMVDWSSQFTFVMYAVFNFIGGIFALFFMKETRGLSKRDLSYLYAPKHEFQQLTRESASEAGIEDTRRPE